MKRIPPPFVRLALISSLVLRSLATADTPLQLAYFEVDATPPIGSWLAYDEMTWIDQPLSCRGAVLLGDEKPVVLCAVDWIGIANGGQDAWKQALAEAAHTTPDRVAVHTLHQHDAPVCDFTANAILTEYGLDGELFDPVAARSIIARAAQALQEAMKAPQAVTHLGVGKAEVEEVASNRRLLGPDGKVAFTRYTACRDPALRAMPVGTVDPDVRLIGFWRDDTPLLALTFFATHPQSYYRTGGANPDFPGIARGLRETDTGGVPHIHFNGAGGNIGAGKWNDGSKENRMKLALRLSDGMKRAWESVEKQLVDAADLEWRSESVALPVAPTIDEKSLTEILADEEALLSARKGAAADLAWLRRSQEGRQSRLQCLLLGNVRVLLTPGELVVEYQLAARDHSPETFVALAAYGDYGPGYICLTKHYDEGGYEASPRASRVAPEVEAVLKPVLLGLLDP